MTLGIILPIQTTVELVISRVEKVKVRNVFEKVMGFWLEPYYQEAASNAKWLE